MKVPDTLLIQKGMMRFWFYTDKTGQVRRRVGDPDSLRKQVGGCLGTMGSNLAG